MADKWDDLLAEPGQLSKRQERRALRRSRKAARREQVEAVNTARAQPHGQDWAGLAMVVIALLVLAGIYGLTRLIGGGDDRAAAPANTSPSTVETAAPTPDRTVLPDDKPTKVEAEGAATKWLRLFFERPNPAGRDTRAALDAIKEDSTPELLAALEADSKLLWVGQGEQELYLAAVSVHGIQQDALGTQATYYLGAAASLQTKVGAPAGVYDFAIGLEPAGKTFKVSAVKLLGQAGR